MDGPKTCFSESQQRLWILVELVHQEVYYCSLNASISKYLLWLKLKRPGRDVAAVNGSRAENGAGGNNGMDLILGGMVPVALYRLNSK
jgi:hypothetical protein